MARTDIHRPSAIIPEDYEFVAFEHIKIEDMGDCYIAKQEWERLQNHQKETGGTYSHHRHGGVCHICGSVNAIYTAAFYHAKTNTYISVGSDCAYKLDMGDPDRFRTFKKACQAALKNQAGKAKAQAFLQLESLDKAWDIYVSGCAREWNWEYRRQTDWAFTVKDIVGKLVQYGNLSDKQVNFLRKLIDFIENEPARVKRQEEEKAKVPVIEEGRYEVEGIIIKVGRQEYDNIFSRWVMTVKTDDGRMFWGTCPTSLSDAAKGDRIRFVGTITPSNDDNKFGFFKRPSKAVIISKIIPE